MSSASEQSPAPLDMKELCQMVFTLQLVADPTLPLEDRNAVLAQVKEQCARLMQILLANEHADRARAKS